MVDLDRLERLLLTAALRGEAMTYGQVLAFFQRRVTRITVQALCRDLGRIAARPSVQGAPDLACLVVRKADRLPGEGWFTFARAELGYTGPSDGDEAQAFVAACQARAGAYASRPRPPTGDEAGAEAA